MYAPDLRGHGASDWAGPYTIEQLTTDLAAFLDALELAQVALGGHSIGGPPAYLHAARHPASVTRLVLEDPAPPWPRSPRVLARPEGPLPFDWDVTALSNEFTDAELISKPNTICPANHLVEFRVEPEVPDLLRGLGQADLGLGHGRHWWHTRIRLSPWMARF